MINWKKKKSSTNQISWRLFEITIPPYKKHAQTNHEDWLKINQMLKDKIEKKTSIKTQHWIIKLKKITKKNDVYRAIQCSMYKTGAASEEHSRLN